MGSVKHLEETVLSGRFNADTVVFEHEAHEPILGRLSRDMNTRPDPWRDEFRGVTQQVRNGLSQCRSIAKHSGQWGRANAW
jgi:hypothetical protein